MYQTGKNVNIYKEREDYTRNNKCPVYAKSDENKAVIVTKDHKHASSAVRITLSSEANRE